MSYLAKTFNKVMMCAPKHFAVTYKINPWMGGKVDPVKAMDQWVTLKQAVQACGVEVLTIEQMKGLPDMVFCCNAGIVHNNKVYLSHFRHSERQGERDHYKQWFTNNGFDVYGDTDSFFEGGGDAVFSSPDKLWAGYGFRSDKKVYDKVQELGTFKTILCELNNPRFYHLDTCLMPLGPDRALWYPGAFTEESQNRMQQNAELIPVPEKEVGRFACNGITIGNKVILPDGSKETKALLEKLGYEVMECDMSEFLKSGGACQCLIMKL